MQRTLGIKKVLNKVKLKKLKKRIYVLKGKYKGEGLMKALMAEKKREKE
jgi:hypothetical protein